MSIKQADIIIIGGGSAGVAVAASLLKRTTSLSIVLIEPNDQHYYQPAWTLVGGGVYKIADTKRPLRRVLNALPGRGVNWVQAAVTTIDPENNQLTLDEGQQWQYRFLIVAAGLQTNWDGIEGLKDSLGKHGVCSNYSYDTAPYTFEMVQKLTQAGGGKAIFTQAPMPIKCPGAPQKAMYLACSNWEKAGVLKQINTHFYNAGAVLFGVAHYVPPLMTYIERYHIDLNFNAKLVKIDGPAQKIWLEVKDAQGQVQTIEQSFDMLHVTPPQSAPNFLKGHALSNADGFVEVDPATLQHVRYPNVFAVGDVTSTPNSKTAAAARKQVVVVAQNLLAMQAGLALNAQYDGYGSCPLTVELGKIVLAEFGYNGKLLPTFPIEGAVPRWSSWILKKNILPPVYWYAMLRGREWLTKTIGGG